MANSRVNASSSIDKTARITSASNNAMTKITANVAQNHQRRNNRAIRLGSRLRRSTRVSSFSQSNRACVSSNGWFGAFLIMLVHLTYQLGRSCLQHPNPAEFKHLCVKTAQVGGKTFPSQVDILIIQQVLHFGVIEDRKSTRL